MVRYDPDHDSDDVIDRRRQRSGGMGVDPRLAATLFRFVASRWGIGGVLVVAVIGVALYALTSPLAQVDPPAEGGAAPTDEEASFVGFVLDDIQETWSARRPGYQRAQLVLFRDVTTTGCGYGQSAMGPFYCPLDERVYVDLSFFDALARLGGPGDFAQAYVLAHEIGHHVQNQVGILEKARGPNASGDGGPAVRVELMADCFAGVWAAAADQRGILELGDVEEGFAAAAAIGDDRLQSQQGGRVTPDSFTHGTSEQRVRWFRRGLEAGNPDACNTFAAASL